MKLFLASLLFLKMLLSLGEETQYLRDEMQYLSFVEPIFIGAIAQVRCARPI